jgi:hypothetical protein
MTAIKSIFMRGPCLDCFRRSEASLDGPGGQGDEKGLHGGCGGGQGEDQVRCSCRDPDLAAQN